MSELSQILKNARLQKGWTKQYLGLVSKCKAKTIGDWERGRRIPTPESILKICPALGLDGVKIIELCDKANGTYKMCGECTRYWTPEKERSRDRRYGYCSKYDIRTERCQWCEGEKDELTT